MKKEDSDARGGQINTIVFLTLRPVSAFEKEKWGFDYLRSQGFTVEVLDLTELLREGQKLCNSVERPRQDNFIHSVSSYQEFEYFLKKFSGNSFFLDYVMGNIDVTLKEERVFRLLKKHNVQYAFLSTGALPLPAPIAENMDVKANKFKVKAMKAFANPQLLLNYLASKVILFLTRHRIAYPLPEVIFGGNSEILQNYVKARDIDKRKIIPINSFDYDTSMLFLRGLGNKLPESENICVFLDEAATHHSDFAILGIEPAVAEAYFAGMNRFFDFIEKNIGLTVVIAAHPRSNYESMPDVFGGRAVIKGKTVELVARSKLVVMHMSTSLSFAVLFEKPVVPVKIPGMRSNSQLNSWVEIMGAAIGSKPVDLDRDELTYSLLQRTCNLEKYFEYKQRYVQAIGADELPVWEIVAKTVKNMRFQV